MTIPNYLQTYNDEGDELFVPANPDAVVSSAETLAGILQAFDVDTDNTTEPAPRDADSRKDGPMRSNDSPPELEPWWGHFVDDHWSPSDQDRLEAAAAFPTLGTPARPVVPDPTAQESQRGLKLIAPVDEVVAISADTPSWLLYEFIPASAVTLCAGKTRTGKSTLAFHLAQAVGAGEGFASAENVAGPRKTLWVSVEGGWIDELRDRKVEGWDEWLYAVKPAQAQGLVVHPNSQKWREQWDLLAEEIAADGQFGLVVVDHLLGLTTAHGRSVNDDGTAGPLVSALNALAQKTGCAVLLLHHASNKHGSQDPVLGSTAISSQCRALLLLGERSKAKGQQRLTATANRAAGELLIDLQQTPTSITIAKAERAIGGTDSDDAATGDEQTGRSRGRKPRKPRDRATTKPATVSPDERRAAIREALATYDGPRSQRALAAAAKAAGVDASLTTLRNDIKEMPDLQS